MELQTERERAIEGTERRAGQTRQPPPLTQSFPSEACVPTRLRTLFILDKNINERLLKYEHSSPRAPPLPSRRVDSRRLARPCLLLSCQECGKSAYSTPPATLLSHKTTLHLRRLSVYCMCTHARRTVYYSLPARCAHLSVNLLSHHMQCKSMYVFLLLPPWRTLRYYSSDVMPRVFVCSFPLGSR